MRRFALRIEYQTITGIGSGSRLYRFVNYKGTKNCMASWWNRLDTITAAKLKLQKIDLVSAKVTMYDVEKKAVLDERLLV